MSLWRKKCINIRFFYLPRATVSNIGVLVTVEGSMRLIEGPGNRD